MVLDKKTNKEIAETTGLKYWEVRDYIQYIGLAGIREEMLGSSIAASAGFGARWLPCNLGLVS